MKMSIRSLAKDEKGQALVLALILLVIGGLIMAPLLSYMSTGIIAGRVYENKADELYAADAGAEDAVWKIQNQVEDVYILYCGQGNHTLSYNITDVNGKSVAVTIRYVSSTAYNVTSIATGGGSGTKIDAYITGSSVNKNFGGISQHIVCTAEGNLTDIKSKVAFVYDGGNQTANGPEANYLGDWPTAEDLETYYGQNVTGAPHYYSDTTINLNGNNMNLGPLYVQGQLTIVNSVKTTPPPTLTLNGTIYVTGKTFIGTTQGGKEFSLNLNKNTIFVEDASMGTGNEALQIGSGCAIIQGPGVITAVGDIYFQPNSDAGSDGNPVFLLSVAGTTRIRPGINIHGAVAGYIDVTIQSGNKPTITYPGSGTEGFDLNFPTLFQTALVYKIASWEVKPA